MRWGRMALSLLVVCGVAFSSPAPSQSQNQPTTQQGQTQKDQTQEDQKPAHPPVPLNSVELEFPAKAREKLLSGVCFVSVTVDTQGNPQDLAIVRCSDPLFEQNSLDAASKYRFKPAVDAKGKPLAVKITIEINFKLGAAGGPYGRVPEPLLKYGFSTPPGLTSLAPDAHGVYPLSKSIEAPKITNFVDSDFSGTALRFPTNLACDVVLTVDQKGRPSSPQVIHCDQQALEKPATDSLLHSRFKPGTLNGKPVPVRLLVHLFYGGFVPQP